MTITAIQPVHPDDYVSDITVEIGIALRAMLDQRYPGRIRGRLRDSPLTTVPGHTIFVPSTESLRPPLDSMTTTGAAARMLPIVVRDLKRQLHDADLAETSLDWDFAYTWDGHGLFSDGQFVRDGFRFDAYVEVFAEHAHSAGDQGT